LFQNSLASTKKAAHEAILQKKNSLNGEAELCQTELVQLASHVSIGIQLIL
jgi:hypothetical protein